MTWRVGLIDSCGAHPRAVAAVAYSGLSSQAGQRDIVADATGHGSRIADILTSQQIPVDLVLGQVFLGLRAASVAAVAAAMDWAVLQGVQLLHLSLGLRADRAVLSAAVRRAIDAGVLIVAASPARGAPVYPSSYAGVIRATGDARCAADELSHLGPWTFGACPMGLVLPSAEPSMPPRGGASVGAARVTRAITELRVGISAPSVVDALGARAKYSGREQRRLVR